MKDVKSGFETLKEKFSRNKKLVTLGVLGVTTNAMAAVPDFSSMDLKADMFGNGVGELAVAAAGVIALITGVFIAYKFIRSGKR